MSYSLPLADYYSHRRFEVPLTEIISKNCDNAVADLLKGIEWIHSVKKFFNDLKSQPELRREIRNIDGNWDQEFLRMPHGVKSISEEDAPFGNLNELFDCLAGFNSSEGEREIIDGWMDAFEKSEGLESTRE
jgi:hypothetical protein